MNGLDDKKEWPVRMPRWLLEHPELMGSHRWTWLVMTVMRDAGIELTAQSVGEMVGLTANGAQCQLRRLEEVGLVTSHWVPIRMGHPKLVYRLVEPK